MDDYVDFWWPWQEALLNLKNKADIINPVIELGLLVRPTDVKAQKIDGIMLDTYEIVITVFLMIDKTNWVKFFEKTFLVANVSPKVVFEMPFYILTGVDIDSYMFNGVHI